MTQAEILTFENDFNNKTGMVLRNEIMSHPQLSKFSVDFVVNRIERMLYDEIKANCPTFEKTEMSDEDETAVNDALVEQIVYTLFVGDFTLMAGYEATTGTTANLSEIRKRTLSPEARKILTNAGLFYRGMKRKLSPYEEERLCWR